MQYNLINKNNHIKKEELANLDLYYGNTLPNVYLDFLRYSNGYLFPNSSLIYSSFEIVERNITNEVNKYLNDYIAIGEGDGDKLYLMKKILARNMYILLTAVQLQCLILSMKKLLIISALLLSFVNMIFIKTAI